MEKRNNYETARLAAAEQFAARDTAGAAAKYNLESDRFSIFVRMVKRLYRVEKESGLVYDDAAGTEADFSVSLTLYDVLSRTEGKAAVDGTFCTLGEFCSAASGPGSTDSSFFDRTAKRIDASFDSFRRACLALGGEPGGKGDFACTFRLFGFLPFRIQFWQADDEFPPSLRFLFDGSASRYLLFETMFYAIGAIMDEIFEEMEKEA